MFSSKKKIKTKETSIAGNPSSNSTKSFSKQIKSLIGRKKNTESDNISIVTSADSITDGSVTSSPFIEPNVSDITIKNLSNDLNGDCHVSDDELTYPNWYKQTLSLPLCGPFKLEQSLSLNITRSQKGDFGFVLRKGSFVERYINESGYPVEVKHQTIFSEPLQMNRESLLLPGDILMEVNGVDVQERSRDEIICIVKSCGSSVILTIEPVPECLEFSFRRFTTISPNYFDIRSWMTEKKSFAGIYSELYNRVINNFESVKQISITPKYNPKKCYSPTEKGKFETVWINFNEGFASATILEKNSDKCLVRLTENNSEIEVSEEDIHLANSSAFDLEENLILLPHLNESSVLYVIRQRFCNNLVHTYVGRNIIYINPMNNLNSFSDKVMHLFKFGSQEDLPPHVYSVAQNSFENLKLTKENQSICILGRSGSGKTTVLMNVVNYLTQITAVSSNKTNITNDKIQALWVLLDAFTCTKTGITTNASKCGKMISLNFSNISHNLILTGLNLQVFLFDRNRIIRRPEGEPTFHVFYNFLASLNSKQIHSYSLQSINDHNSFMRPLQRESEIEMAKEKWLLICQAAAILGISDPEWDVICRLLASIFHLGCAKSTTYRLNGQIFGKFLNKESSKRAATTLNCSEEALTRAIFEFYKEDLADTDSDKHHGSSLQYNCSDLLNGFVSGIYLEIIEMIVFFINRCFNLNHYRVMHSINVFDPPGFQVTSKLNRKQVGSYEDLIYNYSYEKLIDLHIKQNIYKQKKIYNEENVSLDLLKELPDCNNVLPFLDGNCKSENFDTLGKQGILNFVETEAIAGTEANLIKKIYTLFKNHHTKVVDKKKRVLKDCSSNGDFTIGHCNLSATIKYNVRGWLKCCRELPTIRSSASLLSMCHNDVIQDILTYLSQKSQNDLFDLKYYAKKSVLVQTKLEMDYIINLLSQTEHLSFIYCISPIPNAGLSRLRESVTQSAFDENFTSGGFFSVPFVKMQLQSFNTLSILRSLKFGFPEYVNFKNFLTTIKNVLPSHELPDESNLNGTDILRVLSYLKIKPSRYRIGSSQIFFQMGTLFDLTNSKELAATNFIVKFQSICRRYLAIKRVEKKKRDADAVRIIQRNCLAYARVKEWAWWKLFSQIRPLLTIMRSDQELKEAKLNADVIFDKCRELEQERNSLKIESRRLEELVDEMKNDQIIQRQKLQQMAEILHDKETNEVLLSKNIEELNDEMLLYSEKIHQLENELSSIKISSVNGDGDTTEAVTETVNEKCNQDECIEELLRQSQVEKEQMNSELEKYRKRYDNIKQELNDFKYEMDNFESTADIESRKEQLEYEISRLKLCLQSESNANDNLKRECVKIAAEKLTLEQLYDALTIENLKNVAKLSAMDRDGFDETDFYDERELSYRKRKMEYEQRIRELEEEVDEINDNYDISQQERLKLQSQVERLNRDKINEENEREGEIEILKASNARKVKNLEMLLEEDQEKRQALIKEKKENERIIADLRQQLEVQRDIGLERKLKKELRITREKLNEALDHIDELNCRKEDKTEVKELRDKLEDAENSKDIYHKQNILKDRELEEYNIEMESLKKIKSELEEKLKTLKSDLSTLQNVNEDFESELREMERKYKQLQTQNLTTVNENNILREKVDSEEEERRKLISKISKLEEEVLLLTSEKSDKSEVVRLQHKISDLEMKLRHEETIRARFQTTNERLKEQLLDAQSEKESLENKEKSEQDKTKRLQKQFKEAKYNLENQAAEMDENSKKIKSQSETISDLQEELESKNKELSKLQQNVQRLEQMLRDEDDSDHSFSEVLHKADSMIKKRKFSIDQGLPSPKLGDFNRRNSIATERRSTTFEDLNEY